MAPATTPAMAQYAHAKREHPDALVLMRMGDFYEAFHDDAKRAAELFGITLTKRSHGRSDAPPMAGVPFHALDEYIAKAVRAGQKVAIVEQMEDSKKAKGLIRREVARVVSPGTILADTLLESGANNFIVAVAPAGEMAGLAVADLSTGEFAAGELEAGALWVELEVLRPAELIAPVAWLEAEEKRLEERLPRTVVEPREGWSFEPSSARESLTQKLGTASLRAYEVEDLTHGLGAASALWDYLRESQQGQLPHIARLGRWRTDERMHLDTATIHHLELLEPATPGGAPRSILLATLDRTETPMGARLLRRWLVAPLVDVGGIERRLDGVETFVTDAERAEAVRVALEGSGDLERLVARIACGRAGPRDLSAVGDAIGGARELKRALEGAPASILGEISSNLWEGGGLVETLSRALVDGPPALANQGGFVRPGYDEELDRLRAMAEGDRAWLLDYEANERERTGIASLKVRFNRAFGYFIEVSKSNLRRVPDDYARRQTLVGGERFTTGALREREAQILGAEEAIAERERAIFDDLCAGVTREATRLLDTARAIAVADVLRSLAWVATERGYVRPEVEVGGRIAIGGGRHPVLEELLPPGQLISNDTELDVSSAQILLITGPNMGGKSVYMRQVALIVLMAQMGSFVPAASATVGLVDRIFTRVGASDNLSVGESTFMAEMTDVARILHHATSRSLVLLDEVGRGTSTYDGMSLAQAIIECLHEGLLHRARARPRALVATHYHELTQLEAHLEGLRNYSAAVHERKDDVAFLYKIVPGASDRSFGIHAAKRAGVPPEVTARAEEILTALENERAVLMIGGPRTRRRRPQAASERQLDLFSSDERAVLDQLRSFDPLRTPPLDALTRIEAWKRRLNQDGARDVRTS